MENIIRQCAGIDCAKADFVVTFSVCDSFQLIRHEATRSFRNDFEGFRAFNKWLGKLHNTKLNLVCVMEATGVYHEKLAHFLYDLGYQTVVLLPKQAKDFSKTMKVKRITDKVASQYISTMGLEKKLDLWIKPKKIYRHLRSLTREKDRIQKQIQEAKNQLHAEKACAEPLESNIQRITATIDFLKTFRKQVIIELKELMKSDQFLQQKVNKIMTIPGVAFETAITVIAETHGFEQFHNKRQLVSYAGYDVINHESGSSIRTKHRMSKRGNKRIRKALHMPALASIKWNDNSQAVFTRIVSRSGIKMKGVVAIQRKLLVLMYTLWKTDTEFDPQHESKKEGSSRLPHELDQVRSKPKKVDQI